MAIQGSHRYWGTDVSTGQSLSLDSLHDLARERQRVREGTGDGAVVEAESGLPVVTSLARGRRVSEGFHRQLPQWIAEPRLVTADIASGSVPLSALALPHTLTSNLRGMGYTSFFPVQLQVIPELLSGSWLSHDVCVCAPTGCGKTLCYVVPMVTKLLDCVVRQVRGLVVVPSRLLAQQVTAVFRAVAAHTRVQCGLVCGEATLEKEAALITNNTSFPASSRVDVVIATPGRLVDHLTRGSFSSLHYLRFLVIDEADKLVGQHIQSWLPHLLSQTTPTGESGLGDWLMSRSELSASLPAPLLPPSPSPLPATTLTCARHLLSESSGHVQKLLLSATMTQDPESLALLELHSPLLFSVSLPKASREAMNLAPPTSLSEALVICKAQWKPLALLHTLSHKLNLSPSPSPSPSPSSSAVSSHHVLCFTNSRDTAWRLKVVLEHFNWFSVSMVTSEVGLRERKSVLSQFKRGEIKVLICSDGLARGMDMPECSCVVNYDPPSLYSTYLHRVGRTARAGAVGHAFSLLTSQQVADFQCMLRVAHRPRMEELRVTSDMLQPLQTQYDHALSALRDTVRLQRRDLC